MTTYIPQNLDLEAFGRELDDLKKEIDANLSEKDYQHLRKIERWGRLSGLIGLATAWLPPNPLSIFGLSQGTLTRWAMITHHVSHRGYDRVPNIPKRYTSKFYAKGWRRFVDWLDWMHPNAWHWEHNLLHHYHTGEPGDPDFVQRNVQLVRDSKLPKFVKYMIFFFFMTHWKLSYYAPNTYWFMKQKQKGKGKFDQKIIDFSEKSVLYPGSFNFLPITKDGIGFWLNCVLPYGLFRFALLPALFLPFGQTYALFALANLVLAEMLTNFHAFAIIVTNHTGDDVECFTDPVQSRHEFYYRQITGSVNFKGGKDWQDFLLGWLNYQIEHHLWPDLPMLKLQEYQPRVEAICEKYGVKYINHSIFYRFKKLLKIMVGDESMKPQQPAPELVELSN